MASHFVFSGSGGASTPFSTWATAATTLAAALGAAAAGDDIYVAHDHSESTAGAVTLTSPGTVTSPCRIICVNRAGSVPPVSADLRTTGIVTNTGANAMTFAGVFYCYGLTFNCSTGSTAANMVLANVASNSQIFESCALKLLNTATTATITASNVSSSSVELINCTVSFGSTSQKILNNGSFLARDGTSTFVQGATLPAVLFSIGTGITRIDLLGLDLSNLTSKTIFPATSVLCRAIGCKIPSPVTVSASLTDWRHQGAQLLGCNSGTPFERNEWFQYPGTLTTETTIVRTAGASDGSTAFSWKLVSTANAKRIIPVQSLEGAVFNSAVGSARTLTFHCVTDNVTLTNLDVWVEVEYLGSSASPQTSLATSASDQLAVASNLTSDSGEAWTTTGLATPSKQSFSVTFTPQLAGPIRWRVKFGKASTTVYVDPNPDLA